MPASVPAQPDLTREEAQNILGVCSNTIDRMIDRGTLTSYKLGPGRRAGRRIRRDSVEKLRNGE